MEIYARPGVTDNGVGLVAIRTVPKGATICTCEAKFSKRVPELALLALHPSVAKTVRQLFDGADGSGFCNIPTNYDQAIPLVSFINHSGEPNCVFDEDRFSIRASRKVNTGEELTVDYLEYQPEGSYTYREALKGFA